MGYKKDIFGIFAYEFELLPKYLEFSNLVCGGDPPSVDQWLHHFETAYKNRRDLFLGIYRYAFEQLSYDLLIVFHRAVFQSVQDGVYIVESGLSLFSLELTISDVAELLLQTMSKPLSRRSARSEATVFRLVWIPHSSRCAGISVMIAGCSSSV